jgi:electron transport complex protein RnfA
METIIELAGVAVAALLSENLILVSSMGVGTRLKSLQNPRDAMRTGGCLTVVMVLGALCSWVIDRLILSPLGLDAFRLLAFALLIPGLVAGLRRLLRLCVPELSRRVDENLASISTNCAALGSALLISQRSYGLLTALIFALFGGLGAAVALTSFASLQLEVDLERCPRPFRGFPIQLITPGLMALALVGFYGLHLN